MNSLFGMSYVVLLPVFAREVLRVGSQGFGFLMGVSGIGALVGSTTIAVLGNVPHKGALMLSAAAGFGLLLIVFAFSQSYILSLGVLLVSGTMNAFYMTSVNTSLQALVPDHLRGRVMGVYSLTWSLIPLGGLLGGGIATVASAPIAVGLGGGLTVAVALAVALTQPQVRRL